MSLAQLVSIKFQIETRAQWKLVNDSASYLLWGQTNLDTKQRVIYSTNRLAILCSRNRNAFLHFFLMEIPNGSWPSVQMHHGQVSDAAGRLLTALSAPSPPGRLEGLLLPFSYSAL